jgi:hypothetical protein
VDGRVRRAKLPGRELIDGRVDRNELLIRPTSDSKDEGEGSSSILELLIIGNGGEGHAGATVGGVDELVRQHTTPVVGDGALVTGLVLVANRVEDVVVVAEERVLLGA